MAADIWRWLAALAGLAALSLMIGLPTIPGDMLAPDHRGLVLELPLLLAALSLIRVRPGPAVAWVMGGACWLVLLLRLADLVAMMAAGRRFEPAFDPALIPALWDVVATGAGGLVLGVGLIVGLGSLLLLCRWLAGLALAPLGLRHGRPALLLFGLGYALATLTGMQLLQPADRGPVGAIAEQAARWREAQRVEVAMRAAMDHDPAAGVENDKLFSALRGRPIILAWVESYGFSALTDPRQAETVRNRLATLDGELAAAGFRCRSGLVESPVIGGRSWLAHGTLRAGIRQDQPLAQQLVLAADRGGLVSRLNQAGWWTVAAMPGLSMQWLEGAAWGFEQVLDHTSFPYDGPAFGWSPMPDQVLLAALTPDRLAGDGRPLFLEIVLTSSHAPWTPLPSWQDDGGSYAQADLRPDYRDMAGAYGRSLDYSLRALGDWLVRRAPADALVIILGDHPALDWISQGRDHLVPLHILSRDAGLLDRLDGLALTEGMVPDAGARPLAMWNLYPELLARFGPQPLPQPPIHEDMTGRNGGVMP